MTIFPARSPQPWTASRVACHGVASTMTCEAAAASRFDLTAIPEEVARVRDFSEAGSRTPNVTAWPRRAHALPSVSPTPPAPITAIFTVNLLDVRRRPSTSLAESPAEAKARQVARDQIIDP